MLRARASWLTVQIASLMAQGPGFGAQDSLLKVRGLELMIQGAGIQIQGAN